MKAAQNVFLKFLAHYRSTQRGSDSNSTRHNQRSHLREMHACNNRITSKCSSYNLPLLMFVERTWTLNLTRLMHVFSWLHRKFANSVSSYLVTYITRESKESFPGWFSINIVDAHWNWNFEMENAKWWKFVNNVTFCIASWRRIERENIEHSINFNFILHSSKSSIFSIALGI